jgi:hypothetical protein
MNPFPDKLHFDDGGFANGRRRIVTTGRFRAVTSLGMIEVPMGFISDGGSIPSCLAWLVGSGFDDCLEDYVLHDFLYSSLNRDFTRDEADFILKETLWNRSIRFPRILAIYAGVRLFGRRHYKGQPQ